MLFDDKEYWCAYYDEHITKNNLKPSPFAIFLTDNCYIKNKKIVELGCGNGRDSIFFAKHEAMVTAIDQCSNTTSKLDLVANITGMEADFTELSSNEFGEIDVVYSRFTMHSIDEKGEDRVFRWAFDVLKSGGLFCIEARTLKDPLCGKGISKGENIWYFNGHHRRFLDASVFKNKLIELGFKIELFIEDSGLAKHVKEDPIVLRVIAKK